MEGAADSLPRRVQPSRKVKPKDGDLDENWLPQYLKNNFQGNCSLPRALELFTEATLRKTFPEAEIISQAKEVPGIRPDIVMRLNGRTIVVDAKYVTKSKIRKWYDVDKLLRDMREYNASFGIFVIANMLKITEEVQRYCEENSIAVVEANRNLANNLRKVVNNAPATNPAGASAGFLVVSDKSRVSKELQKQCQDSSIEILETNSLPQVASYAYARSPARALQPKKMDGNCDMVNKKRVCDDSKPKHVQLLKKDAKCAVVIENCGSGDCEDGNKEERKSDISKVDFESDFNSESSKLPNVVKSPDKIGKLGVPKQKDSGGDDSEGHGPLKKDGTPDRRFKQNQGRQDAITAGSIEKDGTFIRSDVSNLEPVKLLKKEGKSDLAKDVKSDYLDPSKPSESAQLPKKVGKSDLSKEEYADRYDSEDHGPLKKDGTPDRRFNQNK